jgi:hypothetical protein
MLKKSAYIFVLLTSLTSFSSMASMITTTQTQAFSGTAGNESDGNSPDDFTFEKFNSLLGTLDNVFIKYSLATDNGFIGADNLTNVAVDGTGELGAKLDLISLENTLGFILPGGFTNAFSTLDLTQTTLFNLAADPSQSTGLGGGTGSTPGGIPNTGNSDDLSVFNGISIDTTSGFFNLNSIAIANFSGNSGDTFKIRFDTTSVVGVDVGSSVGTFQAVDVNISMDMYYEYTAAPAIAVPEPAVFAICLLVLCAVTGRKFLK